jgi:prevent-host-death family protein
MQVTNIHDAKTHLSKLIQRAIAGEEIVIAKAGDPMVTLVPYQAKAGKRKGGQWRGKVWVAEDFDDLPPELASAFRGERP